MLENSLEIVPIEKRKLYYTFDYGIKDIPVDFQEELLLPKLAELKESYELKELSKKAKEKYKDNSKEATESYNSQKNRNKQVSCVLCGKSIRNDKMKAHLKAKHQKNPDISKDFQE